VVSENRLFYGSDEPLPEQIPLRAGPLSLIYEDGQLRHLKLGSIPVLHQVYAAVRDHNWGTIPGVMVDRALDIQEDRFQMTFQMVHRQGVVDFRWHGVISGSSDGTLTFYMDGTAHSAFKRNRIGFCVLHPTQVAGTRCTVEYTDGAIETSTFPAAISPHQPFFDLRAITHTVMPGVEARVLMEGDTFEMEDQRNWTDASFKTYCTPLRLPFPVTVEPGTRIRQKITLTLSGQLPAMTAADGVLNVIIGAESVSCPQFGVGAASHHQPLPPRQIERLKALPFRHLRVDLRLDEDGVLAALSHAALEARALGVELELAVWVSDQAESQFAQLRRYLVDLKVPVARLIVFHIQEKSTARKWVELARAALGDMNLPIGAGTDYFFTELNRERPASAALDFVTYSINPQVHAFDNLSLVETLPVQGMTVASAQTFAAGKPVIISPVTLKMRANPNATGPEPEPQPGQLPPQVDARQMSLFGAGWTLGSIKYLAAAGAASVTYYETTGLRGLMAPEDGSPLPDQFFAPADSVYPVYHLFADMAGFPDLYTSQSSDPLKIEALALGSGNRRRVLLANYTPDWQQVHLRGLSGPVMLYTLDASNMLEAMQQPETFRQRAGVPAAAEADALHLSLPPFGLLRVDTHQETS
jgi:hypothetical protein